MAVVVGETAWNSSTSPRTVVLAGATAGDILLVQIMGNKSSGSTNPVTACTITNTAGTVSAWTKLVENFTTADNSSCWHSSAWATVTSTGSVTVSVARTQTGTANSFGFVAYQLTGYSGIGNTANSTNTATDSVSLTVAGSSSFVGYLCGDWDHPGVPTVWTPSGQTVVENAIWSVYAVQGAYWESQAAGTRSYGTTDNPGSTTCLTMQAIEVPAAAAAAAAGPKSLNYQAAVRRSYYM